MEHPIIMQGTYQPSITQHMLLVLTTPLCSIVDVSYNSFHAIRVNFPPWLWRSLQGVGLPTTTQNNTTHLSWFYMYTLLNCRFHSHAKNPELSTLDPERDLAIEYNHTLKSMSVGIGFNLHPLLRTFFSSLYLYCGMKTNWEWKTNTHTHTLPADIT